MSKRYNPEDLITQAEAARLRGVSRQAIGWLLKQGRLKRYVIGGIVFLSRAEVTSFTPKDPGPPPSDASKAPKNSRIRPRRKLRRRRR